jgi:hypothetical protein
MRVGYANPTDRVAAACIAAVKPWCVKFEADLVQFKALANPAQYLGQLVVRLARQAAFQGLLPLDLDGANGTVALGAIADAIFSGKHKTAFFATLPVEWKHVAGAAQRILDRETVRRR